MQEALFACGWERWPRGAARARRALLLARERARRPLRAIAAGIVPLSLDTFLKVIRHSTPSVRPRPSPDCASVSVLDSEVIVHVLRSAAPDEVNQPS